MLYIASCLGAPRALASLPLLPSVFCSFHFLTAMPVPSDVDYFFASSTMLKIAAPVLLLLVGSAIGFDHVGEEFSDRKPVLYSR